MKPTDLICATEIAEELGVKPSAVSNWRKRNVGFPEPWGEWKSGPLWLKEDIEVWMADRAAQREWSRQRRIERLQTELANLADDVPVWGEGENDALVHNILARIEHQG